MLLLFGKGQRPDVELLRQFADTYDARITASNKCAEGAQRLPVMPGDNHAAGELCVEMIRQGLTFDLTGFLPGAAAPWQNSEFRFDCDANLNSEALEAVRLGPGAHLAGGKSSLPILRGLLGLARDMVLHFNAITAVQWLPSTSLIGRRYFESTTTAWLDGGAFPALGLIAYRPSIDGGLQSVGLNFLIGQEIRIEPMLVNDNVSGTRLAVRLANQLVLTGPVTAIERYIGPNSEQITLEPSPNRKFIRVWGR
ncbi:MAG: hypothetical protein EP341_01785 [Sphingomonadales bacterium]|nr:MAG: hypothetical protein EP341_01785 [Sphingomonadales bacterium]